MKRNFTISSAALAVLFSVTLSACGGGGGGSLPAGSIPIQPRQARVALPTEFTVTGSNLPLTAILEIEDAVCAPPENRQDTGFTQTCTPHEVGVKQAQLLTSVNGDAIGPAVDITINLPSNPLNDTGITWGGDDPEGNNTDCISNIAAPQDCMQGRDSAGSRQNGNGDGHAGFSFTKLDSNGAELVANAATWSCVRDNVTGLVWEVKVNDSNSIHHKDITYQWGGLTAQGRDHPDEQGKGMYYDDWNPLVQGSRVEKLCGFDDWRVPAKEELRSLVHYGRIDSAIDIAYFPNTAAVWFWSSSPGAGHSDGAWGISFSNGDDYNLYRYAYYRVRLVRGGQ